MFYFKIRSNKENFYNFIDTKYFTSTHLRSALNKRLVNWHFYYEFSLKNTSFRKNSYKHDIQTILSTTCILLFFYYLIQTISKAFGEITCVTYLFHDLWSHPTWGSNKCIPQFLSTSVCKLYHCGAHSKI